MQVFILITVTMYIVLLFIVCCLNFFVQVKSENCTTRNNEAGQCISLSSCIKLIGNVVDQHANGGDRPIHFVCGEDEQNPMVCCSNFPNVQVQQLNADKLKLLPDRRYCGLQHSDDYFGNSDNINPRITEFPWLARIEYKDDEGKSSFLCAGSLINRKYVITAAHCFEYPFQSRRPKPVAVHLGDYHVKNQTDCVDEVGYASECTEVEIFEIEKTVAHPQYNKRTKVNDIAIVRLKGKINYSDYIRPICLPLPGSSRPQPGNILLSTGWGRRNYSEDVVDIKKKIWTSLITNDECQNEFQVNRINITEKQLCAKSLANNTVAECEGDAGAPLIFSHKFQWQQEGIVSFGALCGGFKPDVYTKVESFIEWILETIES